MSNILFSDRTSDQTQVKNNKQRDTEEADREADAKQQRSDKENADASGGGDILGAQEDQDIIF